MVEKIIDKMIRQQILDPERKDYYTYVLSVRMEQIVTYTVLFVVACLCGKALEGLVFGVAFILLRKWAGGYHAKTYIGCLCGSGVLLFAALQMDVSKVLPYVCYLMGVTLLSAIYIWCRAPVNHPNLQLNEEEKKKCRSLSRGAVVVESLLVILCYSVHIDLYWYLILAINACAFLMIIAKFIKQEVL